MVTGSHPEYHTPNTLRALHDYVDDGGRLACLGGNGCYWRIATSPEIRDVLEIRRTEVGIEPGPSAISGLPAAAPPFELDRADFAFSSIREMLLS